ncbi:UDP-N-acetylmuramyl pentapeptide phosphotransferase/UDP-N-acetylglucosamine-1-phosphate transferase [Pseudoxanthomonas japonensis]|uniref:lipopolysaccharide biosynthesis protein n=1 Tax=Pseudoxanthomonas japonensis TaxID=69284 RepID=UPI002855D650|nr:lipopolysaccharide biosynthesis protein [Pseudoxanthomonas japonensis]MDR7070562.1 UDP-N-acetylmuramyl pentapeptide phosphotransferase/UDP-N-acetylglucosamine-1-phosphate transferase [Pseudoxanthomonas japonensis]
MPGLMVWLGAAAGGAAVGTWLARRYALRGNLLDQPGERRSHQVPTPRGGGIAIVVVVVAAGLFLVSQQARLDALWMGFLPGLLIVAAIGWWDDHRPLSPWSRLAVQAVAALMLAAGAGWQSGQWLPALLSFGTAMVLVNVWNFMDGINGLASSQAALSALAYAGLLTGEWRWLALALFAACLGFLPFNFPKARIFLGDVGSGALGYALAGLLAAALVALPPAKITLALLPFCAFLVDAGFTLTGRILRGERWWTPHVGHLYQAGARRVGHARVTLVYMAFGGVSLLLINVLSSEALVVTGSAAMVMYGVGGVLWFWLRRGWRG